jgi:hypothetical protein
MSKLLAPTSEVKWAKATIHDHNKVPIVEMMGIKYKLVQRWVEVETNTSHWQNVTVRVADDTTCKRETN